MELQYGTEQDHRATLDRAKRAGVTYIWSGDLRRNAYLTENFNFAVESKIFTAEPVESDQESGWTITWC